MEKQRITKTSLTSRMMVAAICLVDRPISRGERRGGAERQESNTQLVHFIWGEGDCKVMVEGGVSYKVKL